MTVTALQTDKYAAFVDYLFIQCERDNGFAARLRRADNPATEYQSWEILAKFNVNLEFPEERLSYALIAAAIARSKAITNGNILIGEAVSKSFEDGVKSSQANMRLRRLLACDNTEEACRILRPMLSLIQSRVTAPLNFAALLKDLLWFNYDPQRTKARWAQQFYRTGCDNDTAGSEAE